MNITERPRTLSTVRWVSLRATAIANMKPSTLLLCWRREQEKVAPIGFIPKGATCQMISGEECALWGSNPRPADYQTQQKQHVTQNTTRQSAPGPTTGLFSCPSTLDVQPITAHREKKNHALGTTAEQLYDLATRFRKSNLNRYDPHTLDPVPRAHLPIQDSPDRHRRASHPMAC